ncbi:MAG: AMP-binding protein [Clostridium sp.]|nr:AMP-binding protein [Clostridium sp.]
MDINTSLSELFEQTIRNHWDMPALTDIDGVSLQFKDVARKVAKLHLLFRESGVRPGDKIALCGKNSAHWGVVFIAAVSYGAVIVPILHEFKSDNIHHLVNHSESLLLFADEAIFENLDPDLMPALRGILSTNGFFLLFSRHEGLAVARAHLNELFGREFPERFEAKDVRYARTKPEETILISYTSGSTGFSKGVMLPDRAMVSNVIFACEHIPYLKAGDPLVLMLPMAHMYGLSIEFLHPFVKGCQIWFLNRTPSPRVLTAVFERIRPKLIVAVPLILEKIIRTRIFPLLDKPLMKLMLRVPFLDNRLLSRVKEKLTVSFGGQLCEIIIGGASLNKEVEIFLRKISFPFTVGYGMTECGPLISYANWTESRQGSCGRVVDRMEVRVDSPSPSTVPGVIYTRGDNVMTGYYKNPEATRAAIDNDRWLNTGDIGCVDADNFIYLRGRDKNMILGASGQNIYPEEIEDQLNNMPYVNESLIIEEDGRLVALIYPDMDNANLQGMSTDDIQATMDENIATLNQALPSYSRIAKARIFNEEFEKTPKKSIKRYLYQPAK